MKLPIPTLLVVVVLLLILVNVGRSTSLQRGSAQRGSARRASDKPDVVSQSRKDTLIEDRGLDEKEMPTFPIPESTTQLQELSPEVVEDLSIITRGAVIDSAPTVSEIRNGTVKDESHFPKYYLKDTLSANTIGTTEYSFAGEVGEEAISWSDDNVSQYPTYYKSDFKGGLTNVGAFFDKNNQYTDITGPRTDAQIGDICYVSKEGEKVCLENDKLQNVPPSLVSDVNQCGFLNSIGLLQYSNRIDTSQERVINGGVLYDNVKGSKKYNEMYSEPLFGQVMECQL